MFVVRTQGGAPIQSSMHHIPIKTLHNRGQFTVCNLRRGRKSECNGWKSAWSPRKHANTSSSRGQDWTQDAGTKAEAPSVMPLLDLMCGSFPVTTSWMEFITSWFLKLHVDDVVVFLIFILLKLCSFFYHKCRFIQWQQLGDLRGLQREQGDLSEIACHPCSNQDGDGGQR